MTGARKVAVLITSLVILGAGVVAMGRAKGEATPRAGLGYHAVRIPRQPAPEKETRVLLETPHVELVAISLPRGSHTATHSDPSAVTIQVLSGSGTVTVDGKDEALTLERAMYLAPGVEHAVTADTKEDLLLLVHKAGPGGGRGGPR